MTILVYRTQTCGDRKAGERAAAVVAERVRTIGVASKGCLLFYALSRPAFLPGRIYGTPLATLNQPTAGLPLLSYPPLFFYLRWSQNIPKLIYTYTLTLYGRAQPMAVDLYCFSETFVYQPSNVSSLPQSPTTYHRLTNARVRYCITNTRRTLLLMKRPVVNS